MGDKAMHEEVVNQARDIAIKVTDLILPISSQIIQALKQGIVADITNDSQDELVEFITYALLPRIFESCQGWAKDNLGDIPVFPDHIKYYYASPLSKIVVIEQKPSVRTMKFYKFYETFFARDRDSLSEDEQTTKYYKLAMPYVVLTLYFYNNTFNCLHVHYRTEPLCSLGDMLFCSNLPNIGSGNSLMCMGNLFKDERAEQMSRMDFCSQVNYVVARFWDSTFNADYSVMMKKGAALDERIANLLKWQDATKEDPFFPLSVRWNPDVTLDILIQKLDVNKNTLLSHLQPEIQQFLAKVATTISGKIIAATESIKIRTSLISAASELALTQVINNACQNVIKDILNKLDTTELLLFSAKKTIDAHEREIASLKEAAKKTIDAHEREIASLKAASGNGDIW
jgi:hypothetical protein